MIRHGDTMVWSASDLTRAAACEYEFLRRLDRASKTEVEADTLQDEIAQIGLAHEAAVVDPSARGSTWSRCPAQRQRPT